MGYDLLFAPPAMLRVQHVRLSSAGVGFFLVSTRPSMCCPSCGAASTRIHSRYVRTLDDLPMHGRRVRLKLVTRRFFCDEASCGRRTFAEPFDGVVRAYARKTVRLTEALCQIGFACGGEGGCRLASRLGMPVSGDTVLDLIRRCPLPATPEPRVLGVDDWAWCRGQRYGTILCDLERHRPVDLLAARSAESFGAWLARHGHIRVISRDRAGYYAQGAAQGAPQALQVADRFHLLGNLRDALVRLLDRHTGDLREGARVTAEAEQARAAAESPDAPALSSASAQGEEPADTASRTRRIHRYQQVVALYHQGVSKRQIMRRLGIHRSTVRRFIEAGQFPERATRPYRRSIDRFRDDLVRRWAEGCHNAAQLYRELKEQGFRGSYCSVRRCVAGWRERLDSETDRAKRSSHMSRSVAKPSAKRVAWLLLREPSDRTEEDQQVVEALWQRCPGIRRATELAHEFAQMVHDRREADLGSWIARTHAGGVPKELTAFADGLKHDEAAVRAALSLEWSNGQVEGQVNRLKLIKRMMYGRGGFQLLRQRVLHGG